MAKIKTFFPRAWEAVDGDGVNRLKIHGGWLVWSSFVKGSESMTFVSDPAHEWKLVPIEEINEKEEN